MTVRSQRLLSVLIAVIASLAITAGASAATLHGTVVHHAARAHSFVIAGPTGIMHAVHSTRSPRVGRAVTVRARRLANGTYAAKRIIAGRTHRRVRVRGAVTYRGRRGYVVSARGVSLLVHRRAGARASSNETPDVGDEVDVTGELDDQGDLREDDVDNSGPLPTATAVELEGVILSLDPAARTLTISADDDQESAATLTVTIPAAFDFSLFKVGHEVELQATPTGPNAFAAVQSAGDDDAEEADNEAHDQGDDDHADGGGHHAADDGTDHTGAEVGTTPAGSSEPSGSGTEDHPVSATPDSSGGHGSDG